jgi:hypothetical protein
MHVAELDAVWLTVAVLAPAALLLLISRLSLEGARMLDWILETHRWY